MTSRELLGSATAELEQAGCPSPRVDAEWLLAHALRMTRSELYADGDHPLSAADQERFGELVARRARREPLAYVLGEWGFRRLTLRVDSRVLVPRPETESVVERCLELLAGSVEPRVLDVGVGSGAIALAIADEHPGARVSGIDVSGDALALARENAVQTGLDIELLERDVFQGLPEGPWELVVSNPPYVDPGDRATLQPEVRDWEPDTALFGRDVTATVAAAAVDVLIDGGALVLEVGDGQAQATAALLASLGYAEVRTTPDLAGRDRVVEGRR